MKINFNFELILVFLLSFVMIGFTLASLSIVEFDYYHAIIIGLSFIQLLIYFFGFRKFILRFGALQYLIYGLFLFFVLLMPAPPDSKAAQFFDLPDWISTFFGLITFFCCLFFSSRLLAFSNFKKN